MTETVRFLANPSQLRKLKPLRNAAIDMGRYAIGGQAWVSGESIDMRFVLVNEDEFDVLNRAVIRIKKMMERRAKKP